MMDILLVKSTLASMMSNNLANTKSDSDCYPAVVIVEFSSICLKFGQVYEDPFYSK